MVSEDNHVNFIMRERAQLEIIFMTPKELRPYCFKGDKLEI